MNEAVGGMNRQDRIRIAYMRAVGDHDHSPRAIEDYYSIADFLPVIRAAVPDVTLEEVCAVRLEDEKLVHCPSEIELERASYCLQVPTGYPTDPDLIGPFATYQDAQAFLEAHPARCKQAIIRCISTLAFEILCELDARAAQASLVTKLGMTSQVLKPLEAPQDVIIVISANLAREVAKYLEQNCPVSNVEQICKLLRTIATTNGVAVYSRDTPGPPEPQLAT